MPKLQRLQNCLDQLPILFDKISVLQRKGMPVNSSEELTHYLREVNVLRSVIGTWKEGTALVLEEEYPNLTELRWKFNRHFSGRVQTQTALEDLARNLTNAKSVLDAIVVEAKKREDELQNNVWTLVHPFITGAARAQMEQGRYADAVTAACKAITDRIREMVEAKTGESLEGAALLQRAFSQENPVICFEDSVSQEAYRQLFTGALTAFGKSENVTMEDALRKLMALSLLMEKLD